MQELFAVGWVCLLCVVWVSGRLAWEFLKEEGVIVERGSNVPEMSSLRTSEADALRDGRRMDVNRATDLDLQSLPGVGPSLARRIVDRRFVKGPFEKLTDLHAISGIGDKTFRRFATHLTVRNSGPTLDVTSAHRPSSLEGWR